MPMTDETLPEVFWQMFSSKNPLFMGDLTKSVNYDLLFPVAA
jgi:hypothetical protein